MKKILIVEDDPTVATIYRNKFSAEGFHAEIAADGLAGLATIQSFRPDAVILDLMLPKMTGVELMKKLRSQPDFQKLPVIVFSSTYLSNKVMEAWKAGATKCLSKASCTAKQLIDVVRGALSENGRAAPARAPLFGAPTPPPSSSPSPTVAAPAPASNDPDAEFQADLRKSFIETLPAKLTSLRTSLQRLGKAQGEAARVEQLKEMYRRVHALTGNAGVSGVPLVAGMSEALEALLKELHDKPKNLTASSLRTVASAVDFLGVLFKRGLSTGPQGSAPPCVLVVDDEILSRRAVVSALKRAKLKSVDVEDPVAAYDLLQESQFDLIILDVDMPGMTGFELCTKLRTLPAYAKTPVVFVTALNDFESRSNSSMSGGNDFIAKPFLFIELAVKAMIYVLRGRLPSAK